MKVSVLFVLLCSCAGSASGSGGDCDAIEREIHDAAIRRGYDGNRDGVPDSTGICSDPNATIQRDFGKACADLRNCK